MDESKSIVVLGGGVGGVVAASKLRKKLGKEHKVFLVNRRSEHIFYPSIPWVMIGDREPSDISRDLSRLEKKGIEFLNTEVTNIDPKGGVVKLKEGDDLSYDYLVIALGADLVPEKVAGSKDLSEVSDGVYNFYNVMEVVRLRDGLKSFDSGKVVVLVSGLPYKGAVAPYEATFVSEHFFRKRKLRDKVSVHLFIPEPAPLAAPVTEKLFEKRDIGFTPNAEVDSVKLKEKEIVFKNREKEDFDLLILIPPHQCPEVIEKAGLTDETGWVPVDNEILKTEKYDNVYAVGDSNYIELPAGGFLPKAGIFAHRQSEAAVENIVAEIKGKESKKKFDGKGMFVIEAGGGKGIFVTAEFFKPEPVVKTKRPRVSRMWHLGKVLFEKYWLRHWF